MISKLLSIEDVKGYTHEEHGSRSSLVNPRLSIATLLNILKVEH
jgi:hypothetical protein